jgi:hypothetical protein
LDKGEAAKLLQRGTAWLAEEQNILYAQDRWSLLLAVVPQQNRVLQPPKITRRKRLSEKAK